MPAKASGEVKTRIVHSPQKNGDIYILERKTLYDPVKKYNRVLSTKLLSKIPKGSEKPVPTRPKRRKTDKELVSIDEPTVVTATRKRVGMMNIIEHIGKTSGIDDAIYASTDKGTAQKILSVARYLLASNGQSLPGITTWQYRHTIPYAEGISEDIYHNLFAQIGLDESLQQSFFLDRCASIKGKAVLAYDSSVFSTYSENQIEARYGYNKTGDGLKTIKYLALYDIESRQPIAFTKQPGNLPDVGAVGNALQQLLALGAKGAEIITDNGYYSEQNLSDMLLAHFDFITLAKTSLKWVKTEITSHAAEFGKMSSTCPFDHTTHGITVMRMHDFTKVRKYGSRKTGLSQGDTEAFRRRIYIHLYHNASRKADEDYSFEQGLLSIKALLEEGTPVEELSESAWKKVTKYLTIRTWGKTRHISFNEKACTEAKKLHGYFALVSNGEKDTFEALRKYRKRESIEEYFRSAKQHADSTRVRVWDPDTLRGRMFVQFVSLCYYEYLSENVRKIKLRLKEHIDALKQEPEEHTRLEKKLKSWLDNTPIYLQLQWFDTVECVNVSSALWSKRWTTELTKRDGLYLQYLGMPTAFLFE